MVGIADPCGPLERLERVKEGMRLGLSLFGGGHKLHFQRMHNTPLIVSNIFFLVYECLDRAELFVK